MSKMPKYRDIEFGGPAEYRIIVQGSLDASWSNRLAGMTVSTTERKTGITQTTLVGRIRDQAELSGVLDTLYNLHLSILSVEKIDNEPEIRRESCKSESK